MDQHNRQVALVSVAVACLACAALFIWRHAVASRGSGIATIARGEMVLMKCTNPVCQTLYEMDKRDCFAQFEAQIRKRPMSQAPPALACRKCGRETAYRAIKCSQCSNVFFYGAKPNDYADRCPQCGHSQQEQDRKKRVAASAGTKG